MDPSFEAPEDHCYNELDQLLRDGHMPICGRDILCLKINVTTAFKRPPRDGRMPICGHDNSGVVPSFS